MKFYNTSGKSLGIRVNNRTSLLIPKHGLCQSFNPREFTPNKIKKYLGIYQVLIESPLDKEYLSNNHLNYSEYIPISDVPEVKKSVKIIKF